ncbi:hypothetical protein AWN76_010805 [Rhodothermaceae bacterium RA]|nr:hypothetical protein AWN76_010805 [Rhodothermaceae bacterium RA]
MRLSNPVIGMWRLARLALFLAVPVLLAACDTNAGQYPPYTLTGNGDFFGNKVAAHGAFAVVGANQESTTAEQAGAAYVFTTSDGIVWQRMQRLAPERSRERDDFAWSLDMHGTQIVVGAPGENQEKGAAYVFEYDGATWVQTARLAPEGVLRGDRFGSSVAIDSDRLLIGAHLKDRSHPDSAELLRGAGVVYYFERQEGRWVLRQEIEPEDPAAFKAFGAALDLHGDQVIVGAMGDGKVNAITDGPGAAYVFTLRGGAWQQTAKLVAPAPDPKSQYGNAVGITDERAVVSAFGFDYDGFNSAGALFTYARTGDAWRFDSRLTPSDAENYAYFGEQVTIYDNRVASASIFKNEGAGVVYLFEAQEETWVEVAQLEAPEPSPSDFFGEDVALTEEHLVVGAPGTDGDKGVAYVLRRDGTGWVYPE